MKTLQERFGSKVGVISLLPGRKIFPVWSTGPLVWRKRLGVSLIYSCIVLWVYPQSILALYFEFAPNLILYCSTFTCVSVCKSATGVTSLLYHVSCVLHHTKNIFSESGAPCGSSISIFSISSPFTISIKKISDSVSFTLF